MWRWSWLDHFSKRNDFVFSTYVEMIPIFTQLPAGSVSVLHVCGDDPKASRLLTVASGCSPRMWRWSYDYDPYLLEVEVFSTYVEMILTRSQFPLTMLCVLHVCGDDPIDKGAFRVMSRCSPRMWDDPSRKGKAHMSMACSPRMWRWSSCTNAGFRSISVFSTYVEMILFLSAHDPVVSRVLHVSGDDPWTRLELVYRKE